MAELVLERTPLTLRIREVLRTAGLNAEIGQPPKPAANEDTPRVPYVIVYPLEGGEFNGPPLDAPDSLGSFMFQITSVGKTGHQCDAVADKVRRVLLGRTSGTYTTSLTTVDVKVIARWSTGAGGLDYDSGLSSLPERFTFGVTLP